MLYAVWYRQMMMMMLSWLFLCSLTQSEKCTEPFRRDEIKLDNTHRCQSKCIRSIKKIRPLGVTTMLDEIMKVLRVAVLKFCLLRFINI